MLEGRVEGAWERSGLEADPGSSSHAGGDDFKPQEVGRGARKSETGHRG